MYHNPRHFLSPLHIYVQDQDEALQNAALLLGGQPYLRRTTQLIEDLQQDKGLTRRIVSNVLALHSLLTLEHVHDFDRPEAAYFSELDPSMPYVEDICLLSDGLADAIEQSGVSFDSNGQSASYGSSLNLKMVRAEA